MSGARRCGSSALSPLLVLDGDCDRWVGLDTTGQFQSSWELPTPVFTGAWSVSLAGEDVLIGGEQGVHQLRAGAWVRVETAPTCELTAAAGGWWWTGDGRLCGPRGCRPMETGAWAGPGCHSGRIVADDRGAWIATEEGLLRAELDGASRRVSTQPTSSVVLDTRRDVLWLLRDGKLDARDPETGDLKQDYPLPYEGSVLAVLRLGAGGELRIERDFSMFQRLQEAAR